MTAPSGEDEICGEQSIISRRADIDSATLSHHGLCWGGWNARTILAAAVIEFASVL